MTEDDPMAGLRNAPIPESMPKLRELRDFMVDNPPPPGGVTDPDQREMAINEFYVRGADAITEALHKLHDKIKKPDPES